MTVKIVSDNIGLYRLYIDKALVGSKLTLNDVIEIIKDKQDEIIITV